MCKQKIRLALMLVMILFALASGCEYPGVSGPYSATELVSKLNQIKGTLPVYTLKLDSPYADTVLSYYYYYNGSEEELRTFFFPQRRHGQNTRIAKMVTAWIPPALDGALKDSKRVTVYWANKSGASTCNFTPGTIHHDSFSGDPYRTCLVWWSEGYTFLFYSVMPLDETLDLINALEKIK